MRLMKHPSRNISRIIVVGAALTTCLNAPAIAYNPPRASSADLVSMLNAQLAPNTRPAYYLDSSSGKRFLFDRTGPHALLQYEDDGEVYALNTSNGPRGDQFYRTDTGRLFLRVTELGNVIVFPMGDRQGAPTSLDAGSGAIIPPPHPADFIAELELLSEQMTDVLGVAPTITVNADLTNYADWTLEAVQTASKGLARAKARKDIRVNAISLRLGEKAGLSIEGEQLLIAVAPADGFAGRPSSEAIVRALASAR
ncbi:DUF4908 domain-containing protein [Hirschia litorea]|uniref:DUF4908 domain-containing protein n=1 Tax=Hirschia litorea TaxID=1199156 RepID=A0ABW2IL34_9PROT